MHNYCINSSLQIPGSLALLISFVTFFGPPYIIMMTLPRPTKSEE